MVEYLRTSRAECGSLVVEYINIGNDFSLERIFERQLEAKAKKETW